MKKIEFTNLKKAVEHGRQFGGWIFHSVNEDISIWYDAKHYTQTAILMDTPTSGSISPWKSFDANDSVD